MRDVINVYVPKCNMITGISFFVITRKCNLFLGGTSLKYRKFLTVWKEESCTQTAENGCVKHLFLLPLTTDLIST